MSPRWSARGVSDWMVAGEETQGLHQHSWLRHPSEPRTWLFKPARPERERSIAEDVAERLACAVASSLGVPAARVELAERHGVGGALVEDARWPGGSLVHGQVLLTEVDEQYDPEDPGNQGHDVAAIHTALGRFGPPPGAEVPDSFSAFDVFAGYLVFDALIAHVDRHDRNWAVLVRPPGDPGLDALCASFDHAASLGFTLSAAEQANHIRNGTVERWASRGHARRFQHQSGTPWASLVDVAHAALSLCDVGVRAWWHDRVRDLDRPGASDLVAAAPRLADETRQFLVELLMVNRRRLLDGRR